MAKFIALTDSYSADCRLYRKGRTYDFDTAPNSKLFARVGSPAAEAAKPAPVVEELPVPLALAGMSTAQLMEIAEARGISVPLRKGKDKIIQAIEAANRK